MSGPVERSDHGEVDAVKAEGLGTDPSGRAFGRVGRFEPGERHDRRGPFLDLPGQACGGVPLGLPGAPFGKRSPTRWATRSYRGLMLRGVAQVTAP